MEMNNQGMPSPDQAKFKGQILNQIYRVWLFRKLLPVLALEVALFSFVFYQIARAVFIQKVFENALSVFFANPPQLAGYLFSSFSNAALWTKVLGIAALVIVAFLIRHITQGILRLILVRENYFSRIGK
jgi:hypothetical protein